MGSGDSKMEITASMKDQHVKHGGTIRLSCDVKASKECTSTWQKNGEKLECLQGKHTIKIFQNMCTLEIKEADITDEGRYTFTVRNSKESASCFAMVYVELQRPWRNVNWETKSAQSREQDKMISDLKTLTISNQEVRELHFLLCGRVGGGKSSTINTIKSIFIQRPYVNCFAGVESDSETKTYEKYAITDSAGTSLPFAFFDTMGLETNNDGINCKDLFSCLKGHVNVGYTFNHSEPLTERSKYYVPNPRLSDKIHCLLYIVPADKISLIENKFIEKFHTIREEGKSLGIPQVVLMTKVDSVCPLSEKDLQNVYKSKKIKEKMQECSNALGVPMNCIFPIQNYHNQTNMNEDINCLMLDALTHITRWANDFVQESSSRQNN